MKTPEELALEYAHRVQLFWDGGPLDHHIVVLKEMAFLAGYQAAKDEDSCEHILDMEKMVDVNGWISVKDRLPEIGEWVVVDSFDCCQRTMPPSNKFECIFVWKTTFNHYLKADAIKWWMPLPELPEPPKEEE